jgi:hypothetical protein
MSGVGEVKLWGNPQTAIQAHDYCSPTGGAEIALGYRRKASFATKVESTWVICGSQFTAVGVHDLIQIWEPRDERGCITRCT